MMFGGYGGFGMWGMMIVNLIVTVAVIVGLVVFVVWAIRRAGSQEYHPGQFPISGQSAKEIAQQRYARGEIDRDQYQQILSDISK